MEMPPGPFCQSCGMPLMMDEAAGGTEIDGSHSSDYCSHCYMNGAFTQPNLTLAQMQARLDGIPEFQAMPEPMRQEVIAGIAHLQRWNA